MRSAPETAACWLRAALNAFPPERRGDLDHVSLLDLLGRALVLVERPVEGRDPLRSR
ncbi:hypothetical protein AB0395_08615 [Streptosporangium sp. NPDC051023]|uniref:hypothetical protein n=1 Tax=Streptosporangium sp. NPDC051023 TaxID=3155410 RepID=UPI0034500060